VALGRLPGTIPVWVAGWLPVAKGSDAVTGEGEHRPLRKFLLMLSSIHSDPSLVTEPTLPRLLRMRCDGELLTFFSCFTAVYSLPCNNMIIVLMRSQDTQQGAPALPKEVIVGTFVYNFGDCI